MFFEKIILKEVRIYSSHYNAIQTKGPQQSFYS